MLRELAFVVLCIATLGAASRSDAQEQPREPSTEPEYSLDGQSLRITRAGSNSIVDLGCEGRAVLRIGIKLLVACGSAGVAEFDLSDPLSPRRDGTMYVNGVASGLFLEAGAAWVVVSHLDTRPVRIGTASAGAEQSVQFDLGPRGVSRVRPARVRSGGDTDPDDVPASDTAKESPSIVAPERKFSLWEMSLEMGAFVTMGSLGVGELGSASVSYRFEAPFVVRAEVAPFGLAGPTQPTTTANPVAFGQTTNTSTTTGGGRAVTAFAAHLIVGLDTEFVEVGLGAGGASVNQSSPLGPSGGGQPATGAVSIAEEARLGARDGFAVNVESSAIAVNQKFDLGYFVASLQIPVSRTVMIIARGGGGNVGFAYGDLGVRVVVRGDGGRGTLALTGFAGGAAIMESLCSSNPDSPFTVACNRADLLGPSLGGGVEWRL